ncbi:cupin domain-containing protein [Aureimonas fodinaquatilis]|uniref:Cupin domain-containing protein n=1 Tax=Aureimonas fodinaquatilis TaxID=2565783 RepID=A0A5B0E2N4_9HYPH|nr:cupin domain-containing protein [Aureimonas fodinaquatilis]KAA0972385.1 cupin domain-containing protein [Aureimonas fodinaquatilis]
MSARKHILSSEEISGSPGLQKTHFVNAEAQRINRSLGDMVGLTRLGFHLIEVEPGKAPSEPHMHHFEDECVFVLDGEAIVTIGDEEFPVKAGDFIGLPAGGPAHCIRNSGATMLRCLVAGNRLDHDVVDYPAVGKRLFKNKGMQPNLVDLASITNPVMGQK